MSHDLDVIEKEIHIIFIDMTIWANSDSHSTPAWTREIKERLAKVAKRHGWNVSAEKCKNVTSDWGEWLYDMVWYEWEEPNIISLPLIMESEWKNTGMFGDFHKLIVGRAAHRLMVFEMKTQVKMGLMLSRFIDMIKTFEGSQDGDRYMFECWISDDRVFMPHIYVVAE